MKSWCDLPLAWSLKVNNVDQESPATVHYSGGVTATTTGDELQLTFAPTFGDESGTACQGNDARLSDSRRWRKTGPIQIDDAVSGTLPLACMSSPYPIPKVGLPVRLCDMQPICYDDTNGNYCGDAVNGALFVGLTGPIYDYADDAGLIYPSMISDGGGAYHVNFYSDAARTKLFGHTASFSAVGSVNFTADNSAALSGTVVITGTLAASASASLQVYRYGIIDGADESTGSINWTGISITGCLGIWIGTPEMVVPLDVSIKGSYAEATSSQALFAHNARKVYWDRPVAHLAFLRAEHGVPAEAVQPKIAMVHNGVLVHSDANAMTVGTTRGQSNDFLSVDSARRIAFSQPVEMRVQAGTGTAQNLSATAVYILE